MVKSGSTKIKTVIIIMSVLLALSLAALAGALIHNRIAAKANATVAVPDNLITPDGDNGENHGDISSEESENTPSADTTDNGSSDTVNRTESKKQATAIALYNKQSQDNTAFAVGNMFPGDTETKYYRVQVSYHDKVTVHFKTDIRKGYEKLSEVMRVRVKLLNTDAVMYDGLMKDMPDSVTYKLVSYESTTDELYYEITAYLDTSVGNEYRNKDLVADFEWWVEETGNLDKAPQTGDNANIMLWITVVAVFAAFCVILLVFRRKKEDAQNG